MNFKLRILNVRDFWVNNCHPEALEGRLYSYAFLITNCALILFLVNCDLKVKTDNIALFKLISQFVTSGVPQVNIVGTPTLNPPVGTYNTDQQVTLSTATSGAAIYYTTDGTAPTASSTLYASAIPVAAHGTTKTIQAIAIKSGMTDSGIASGTYVIKYDSVAMPTMSPAAGTYSSSQSIALSTTTTGATIYYTLDGTTPTTSSTQYTGAISLSVGGSTTNLQAIAVKTGMANSSVASGSYVMNFISSPTFSPTAGTYGSDQLVTIDTLTFGATIYYTLDGTTPTPSSLQYNGTAISISGNGTTKTIKALAIKSGLGDSLAASGTWTIDKTLADVSINSVSPGTMINGTTDPQINWQSNSTGSYIVKVGGTNCTEGNVNGGTNTSGNIAAGSPIVTTIKISSLVSGTNVIRFCVRKYTDGNYGSITQSLSLYPQQVYAWGIFTDNLNGTIRFDGVAGIFGGFSYDKQTLIFMKCSDGQTWNSGTNNCDGTAVTFQYCSIADNSCNSTLTWLLGGTGFSTAHNTCSNNPIFAGISNWRVPTKNELKTLIHCVDREMPYNEIVESECYNGFIPPTINSLFPNTPAAIFWTASAYSIDYSYYINFSSGGISLALKNTGHHVRCVSGP